MCGIYYLDFIICQKNEVPVLGVPDQKEMPTTFLTQLTYPFKLVFSGKYKSKENNQSIPAKNKK
jgi:hypothetical protein